MTALREFHKQIADVTATASLPLLVLGLILLVAGIGILWRLFSRRSRLLRPEALELDRHNRQHLKGRKDDIDRLSKFCHEFSQVHLVGDSGAGKSTLVLAGLYPELTAHHDLFPLYLEAWGDNWENGPRTILTSILWKALSENDRQTLRLTAPPKPEEIASLLGQMRSVLGRTPLLIFDQFDDYQARHRDRFISSSTWLSAEELVKANPFWKEIETLLKDGNIHCLFVTRSDTADGLEAVRFVTPKVYHLDRLPSGLIEPLLTELTTPADGAHPIIQSPDRGWNRLKQRLVRDLTQEGTVLPSQMKMAFQGLATLKALTVRDYERAGGVRSLEAGFVESNVANASHHSGLAKRQALILLAHLVEGNKTIPRPTAYLTQVIATPADPQDGPIEPKVKTALDHLQQRGIIRVRIDPDSGENVWLLYHDYLCGAVLEAERRANRWFRLAHDAHRAFQEAGRHLWRRWQSLLTPWQQMILAIQRIRGQFRYGPLRSYAFLSLLRFVPYPVLVFVAVVLWMQISASQEARHILAQIGLSEFSVLSQTELDNFWTLATSRDTVRYRFLNEALASPGNATTVNRRANIVAQAVTGLDPNRREKIIDDYILSCIQRTRVDRQVLLACINLGTALSVRDSKFLGFAIDWLATQVVNVAGYEELYAMDRLLQAVVEKPPNNTADQAFTQLIEVIGQSTDSKWLRSLAKALAAVPGQLSATAADQAFDQLIEVIGQSTDPEQLRSLAEVLAAVAGNLDQRQLIELLKWPSCIGDLRSAILSRLERETQQDFHDNIWEMVKWAQSSGLIEKLHLDLRSPPSRELVSATR